MESITKHKGLDPRLASFLGSMNAKSPRVHRPGTDEDRPAETDPLAMPEWALHGMFAQGRIVAWEGETDPLSASCIFPSTPAFIQALALDQDRRWHEIIHPADQTRVKDYFDALTRDGRTQSIEYRLVNKTGTDAWIRHSVVDVEPGAGKTTIRGFVADIQAEKAYQLQSMQAEEREKNRIAQDLHDDLCQVLAGISLLMRATEDRIMDRLPQEAKRFRELNRQLSSAMERTRSIAHGLFTDAVLGKDIRAALEDLARQMHIRFGVEIRTQFPASVPAHTGPQVVQLYRIAQEAMSNSIKHGGATEIALALAPAHGRLQLTVQDNGRGLPQGQTARSGMGWHSMRCRADVLGADINLYNDTSGGAVLRLVYPVFQ